MSKNNRLIATGLILICLLCGCRSTSTSTQDTAEQSGNFAPDTTLTPGVIASEVGSTTAEDESTASQAGSVASETESAASNVLPVDVTAAPNTPEPQETESSSETPEPQETESSSEVPEPTDTPEPTVAPYSYSLIPISDRSMGFIFAYPEGWVNLPGKSTICYREVIDGDAFPARVAVAAKSVAHTPKSSKVLSEFESFADKISDLYDSDTFEFIDQSTDSYFMGQPAYETYYLGYSGDTEIKGYMIACGIDNGSKHYIMIFHFCASYEDFDRMSSMMKQMRDTVMFAD